MANNHIDWNDPDNDRRLREYVAAKMSGGQIAAAFGATRNTVIGACHRKKLKLLGHARVGIGLDQSPAPKRKPPRVKFRLLPKYSMTITDTIMPERAPPPATSIPKPEHLGVQIYDLNDYKCKAIEDDKTYCGHPVKQSEDGLKIKSFCPYHCAVFYTKEKPFYYVDQRRRK